MIKKKQKAKKKTPKRCYSPKTLKVLFALSGNQCAHPECTNTLVESGTEESDVHVSAQICHIFAISEGGPRGKSGLTSKELNSPENLILLCRHHHGIVDDQHETYTADMIQEWKTNHEAKMQSALSANFEDIQPDVFSHPYFPTEIVDQKIKAEVDILQKSRFFVEFDRVHSSISLGKRLTEGELTGGTNTVRSTALAWCARILSVGDKIDKAEKFLEIAKSLGDSTEIEIAEAFILSQKGNKSTALSLLANINSPNARSVAFMCVIHNDGSQAALEWLEKAKIETTSLDSYGKFSLLGQLLDLAHWKSAMDTVDTLDDQDLVNVPVLHHLKAITYLLSTVPDEFRSIVLNQLPFEAGSFPLASDKVAMDARLEAQRHFTIGAEVAQKFNCTQAAIIDDEYALWLELRNPETTKNGHQRLKDKLRGPEYALRFVPLGLQFGVQIDLIAVRKKIDQQIALHGGITYDAAIVLFALAFTQKTPEAVANHISQHYDELSEFLDSKSMLFIQIEMFSRAGMPKKASEQLELLLERGLSKDEETKLRGIISESEGTDTVENRKFQFAQSNALSDLHALVVELEKRKNWDDLCEYSKILFDKTRSLEDAELFATSLTKAYRNKQLVEFLENHTDLCGQSRNLQMIYCWSLYHEGNLLETKVELAKMSDKPDDQRSGSVCLNSLKLFYKWIMTFLMLRAGLVAAG